MVDEGYSIANSNKHLWRCFSSSAFQGNSIIRSTKFLWMQMKQISLTRISNHISQLLSCSFTSSSASFSFLSLTFVQIILWYINASVRSPHSNRTRTAVTASPTETNVAPPSRPEHLSAIRAASGFCLSNSACETLGWICGPVISGRRRHAS